MSEASRAESMPDSCFDRILAENIESREAGTAGPLESWIRRYPEYEQALREFAANDQRLQALLPGANAAAAFDLNVQTLLISAVAAPTVEPIPDRLRYFGDYELIEEVARGGMGVVYRGRQVSLNRPVAVKMILSGDLATPADVARFRLEAEAAANLDHSGIVPIYEIGEREGRHYFSMKFIAGESLAHRLKQRAAQASGQPQPPNSAEIRETVRLVIAVARAVHYAHQRGIIHRDLKPANILLDEHGAPQITDFGLAKRVAGDSHLTHTGAIVGTPSYMAPEQAHGDAKSVTTAADIYGLGAILYALLGNRPPFEGDSNLETLWKVQTEAPTPLNQLCPALDRDLESVCNKCLAKDPAARYHSAGELADDLDRWLNGEPVSVAPPSLANLLWRWLATNFYTAACVVALGILAGLLVSDIARNLLAHNVGSYLGVYQSSFSQLQPPWMLQAIAAYPRWMNLLLLPPTLVCYLGMGWWTDLLVRPKAAATALLAGMGVGSTAALTAFLAGVGWATLNQVAVWPAQPDLELLAGTIDHDTTFTDGRTLAEVYPQVPARRVMKKVLADLQSHIPLALVDGLLFSIGILFLPATCQTWAAYALRRRGDGPWRQLGHVLELSLPMSLLLIGWGFLLFEHPGLAGALFGVPLMGGLLLEVSRPWPPRVRRSIGLVVVFSTVLGWGVIAARLFNPAAANGFNLGLLFVGVAATVIAVVQRWPWWGRVVIYGAWLATFAVAGGMGGSFDAEQHHTRLTASLIGSGIVAVLTGLMAWHCFSSQHDRVRGRPVPSEGIRVLG